MDEMGIHWKADEVSHGDSVAAQLYSTLWNPVDCSPPGSSVPGISQAGRLEWVAISFSRGASQSRDWTHVSCLAGRFFTIWVIWGAHRGLTRLSYL